MGGAGGVTPAHLGVSTDPTNPDGGNLELDPVNGLPRSKGKRAGRQGVWGALGRNRFFHDHHTSDEKASKSRDFPGDPVDAILRFHRRWRRFHPWLVAELLCFAVWSKKKKKFSEIKVLLLGEGCRDWGLRALRPLD